MAGKPRKRPSANDVLEMIRQLESKQLYLLADKIFSHIKLRPSQYDTSKDEVLAQAIGRVGHIDSLKEEARAKERKDPSLKLPADGSRNIKALATGLIMRGLTTPGTFSYTAHVEAHYWRLRWSLRRISPRKTARDLKIVTLKDKEHLSYGQIADKLDMREKAVEKAYKRMKARLPKRFDEYADK